MFTYSTLNVYIKRLKERVSVLSQGYLFRHARIHLSLLVAVATYSSSPKGQCILLNPMGLTFYADYTLSTYIHLLFNSILCREVLKRNFIEGQWESKRV